MVQTNRLALRILQNRTGLVPKPSWCSYELRARDEGRAVMTLEQVRRAFLKLGDLDLVRLAGPEPLDDDRIFEVAEIISEVSAPSVLHLTTNGSKPERAEDFARGLSSARPLRILVELPPAPVRESSFEDHRRFATAIETLKRLRAVARDRGFEVGALRRLHQPATEEELWQLRESLASLDLELFVIPEDQEPERMQDEAKPGVVQSKDPSPSLLESVIEFEGGPRLARRAERYLLKGALRRSRGTSPNRPRCTSLRSHIRLLSDGTVPTCGFRGGRVGNLIYESFDGLWFGPAADEARLVVEHCGGCWAAEESIPSALYTGELVRALGERRPPKRSASVG